MTAVWVALIVAVSSMCSPMLLAYITGRQRRQEKIDDQAREDVVSERLLAAQAETIRRTDAVAARLAESTASTDSQLKQIHTLVNSSLTEAKQAELDSTRREVVLLKQIIVRDGEKGAVVADEVREMLAIAEAKIVTLAAVLHEREQQTRTADAEREKDDHQA